MRDYEREDLLQECCIICIARLYKQSVEIYWLFSSGRVAYEEKK